MPVIPTDVIEALRPVNDPELHRSIVELDMVRDVAVDGGAVAIQVALTDRRLPAAGRDRPTGDRGRRSPSTASMP